MASRGGAHGCGCRGAYHPEIGEDGKRKWVPDAEEDKALRKIAADGARRTDAHKKAIARGDISLTASKRADAMRVDSSPTIEAAFGDDFSAKLNSVYANKGKHLRDSAKHVNTLHALSVKKTKLKTEIAELQRSRKARSAADRLVARAHEKARDAVFTVAGKARKMHDDLLLAKLYALSLHSPRELSAYERKKLGGRFAKAKKWQCVYETTNPLTGEVKHIMVTCLHEDRDAFIEEAHKAINSTKSKRDKALRDARKMMFDEGGVTEFSFYDTLRSLALFGGRRHHEFIGDYIPALAGVTSYWDYYY